MTIPQPFHRAGCIASVEGEAVGYLLAVYVFNLEHLGITAEIDEFFVLPSQSGYRGGAELLKIAELEFLQAGCTNVSLQLLRGNESARPFYHRHGYRERSTSFGSFFPNHIGTTEEAISWLQ